MTNVYTYSEARQRLADLLKEAAASGEVRIRRKDGQEFTVRPAASTRSALDVPGVAIDITAEEIVEIIREGREEGYH